ncbi:MAG TPA: fibronectin type III domain-containing protein [Solirubrobacteraceae bacterium]|nr:fibronectin type III domain-containing protein [Solirubrobacteraceae bacterium]
MRLALAAAIAVLALAGIAMAASTPSVTAESASAIGNFSATLTATIDPNGSATGYVFQYGTTSAYGLSTKSHTLKGGTKPVAVHVTVTGLTPGTVYHFHVAALNGAGTTSGQDRTFTTTGPPPAAVVTGPAVNVGRTIATATGSINPQGAPTTWEVRYGTTTNYTVQTIAPNDLAAVSTSLPVSILLNGLAPGTLFHYQVVGYHEGGVTSYGADQTFFTEPSTRPKPSLSARTTPSRSRHKPYSYTTSGSLGGARNIPASAKCNGSVALKYYIGSRKIGNENGPVGSDCKFSVPNAFRHIHAPARITIKIHFNGNGYLTAANKTNTVTAG